MINTISSNIIQFMFGGNATFTIDCGVNHFAYKIRRKSTDDDSKIYWCLLVERNKNTYCGYFKINGNRLTFRHSNRHGITYSDERIQTLLNAIHKRGNLPDGITIRHVGRCACCGRILTDSKSNERGFGPECWKKIRVYVQKDEV